MEIRSQRSLRSTDKGKERAQVLKQSIISRSQHLSLMMTGCDMTGKDGVMGQARQKR